MRKNKRARRTGVSPPSAGLGVRRERGRAQVVTAAVTAEYNPFHRGHEHHIKKTREAGATHVVAVMSGAFVQRGEPAFFSKFARAEAAVKSGVDLVVELPVRFALSSSERFAAGAVSLVRALGVADILSFGCECGDVRALADAARDCSREAVREAAKRYSQQGVSYPRALSLACRESGLADLAEILAQPNNLLAVDYLRALEGSGIKPLAVKREGAAHDSADMSGDTASASRLRALLRGGKLEKEFFSDGGLPVFAREMSRGRFLSGALVDGAALCRLRGMTRAEFSALPDCASGLGDRLFNASRTASSLGEVADAAKTKRYTHSRVRRALMCALVGVRGGGEPSPPYIRILAIGRGGGELLHEIKRRGGLPLSASLGALAALGGACRDAAAQEVRATDLQAMFFERPAPCGEDFTTKLFRM